MDPLTISPSYPEHLQALFPGQLEFVNFYPEDNNAGGGDREFFLLTVQNLERLLSGLQLGPGAFASMMAFNDSLVGFIDTFLRHRERMNFNEEWFRLDRLVFALFDRFVSLPTGGSGGSVHFSPASRASNLLQLNVMRPEWILRLLALYHRPGSSSSSTVGALVMRWVGLFPQVRRDLQRVWPTLLVPAAWRALLDISSSSSSGTPLIELDLKVLSLHFNQVSASPSERSHLLACALHFAKESRDKFLAVLASSPFAPHLLGNAEFQQLAREFKTELPPVSSSSSHATVVDMDYDVKHIFYRPCVEAGRGGGFDDDVDVDNEDALIDRLRDVCPHLGRYFCRRLLQHFHGDLGTCVQRVMEGDLPTELLAIDFAADEEEAVTVRPAASSSSSHKNKQPPRATATASSTRLAQPDADLKSRLLSMYDSALYNDEYDDTMEFGTRGEGGRYKQQDDNDEEEEGATTASPPPPPRAIVPAAVVHRQQPQKQRTIAAAAKPEFRPMIALVERDSVVDVNGERRNAQGKLVAEDTLMRANTNRDRAAPAAASRKKPAAAAAAPSKSPEEQAASEAERVKRERARKTQQGSRQRREGEDHKNKKRNGPPI